MPFLKIRTPSPASYDAVIAFSKRTGDHAVLSRQDLGILALAYEVHCERNGGPWGLREAPKQELKIKPGQEQRTARPQEMDKTVEAGDQQDTSMEVKVDDKVTSEETQQDEFDGFVEVTKKKKKSLVHKSKKSSGSATHNQSQNEQEGQEETPTLNADRGEQTLTEQQDAPASTCKVQAPVEEQSADTNDNGTSTDISITQELNTEEPSSQEEPAPDQLNQDLSTLNIDTPPSPPETDDDSDGDWITPSNLNSHQAADSGLSATTPAEQIDVATMTTDFAMQNVLLQMNLHLLSTNMQRIKKLVSKVLRCHACFAIERNMSKQFCPRCGGATLKRVNCSTNSRGDFRLHLAKNYQFNKRGDKYSIPKPIAGTANTKWSGQGGGQGGWGRDLILAEDQKEYTRQVEKERREKSARDLMDDDYLPGILTGDRAGRSGGRVKVGAGKNVNSKSRRG